MFSRKSLSAVCAILVTSAPLTLFAQSVVRPAPPEISILQPMSPIKIPGKVRKVAYQGMVPLVSPQEAIAQNPFLQPPTGGPAARTAALVPASPLKPMPPIQLRKNPISQPGHLSSKYRSPLQNQAPVERAASPEVIIRTPFVQPHNPNLYLFVVENVGQVDATSTAVDLYVPAGVVITNVVPANATTTDQRAHVSLAGLKAGAKSIIEVEVTPTTEVVEFQTRLTLESVHQFTTSANPQFASLNIPSKRSKPKKSSDVSKSSPTWPAINVPSTSTLISRDDALISPLTPLAPLAQTQKAVESSVYETVKHASPTTAQVASPAPSALPMEAIDTSARSGQAQPPNITNAIASRANAPQAQLVSSTAVAAQVGADSNLSATVDGPVTLNANELADFSITVTNPNASEAKNVVVQLTVPAGLKVTVLDREAWFDEEHQTISWEISNMGSGDQETIQYRAIGQAIGQQNQKVTIGMENVYQGKAQLVTLVSN